MTRPPAQPEPLEQLIGQPRSLEGARAFAESWLDRVLPPASASPTRLHQAMREAVLLGGKRSRPTLTVLVADAYPGDVLASRRSELVGRMAAAVELVHCASLVHDDLPAFDDADTRRGQPSCHKAFGEPTAILVGDALLTLGFETLVSVPDEFAIAGVRMARLLASATGSRSGIIGGQGLELQTNVDIDCYHSQKTSALFRSAAAGGAVAAGHPEDAPRWGRLGEVLGRILQLRDDLDDCVGDQASAGKPVGRDAALGRPNAVLATSAEDARRHLLHFVDEAFSLLGPVTAYNRTLRSLVSLVSGVPAPGGSEPR